MTTSGANAWLCGPMRFSTRSPKWMTSWTTAGCSRPTHRDTSFHPFVRLRPALPVFTAARPLRPLRRSYHDCMTPLSDRRGTFAEISHKAQDWLVGWWRLIYLGALILVLSLS